MARYKGTDDPWRRTALYEVWLDMLKKARKCLKQSMRYKTGEDFPVDPIFRDFYKFRLWACFCHRYRVGESDGWHLMRRNRQAYFSPENCYFSTHPEPEDEEEITRGARCSFVDTKSTEKKGRGGRPRNPDSPSASERRSRLFEIWRGMVRRCEEKTRKDYPDYGGRGISVCEEWHRWSVFRDWAWEHGYCPDLSIGRVDVNGNYCPENCRWATPIEQMLNRRCYKGQYKNIRATVRALRDIVATLPDRVVATLVIRSDVVPDVEEQQADYPPTPTDLRVDNVSA